MSPSPFHVGTTVQFAWDSTSLGWYKECPRKYYYAMIRGYRAKHESIDLTFGIWYHSALESYYKLIAEGNSHEDALRTVVLKCLNWTWDREKNLPVDTGDSNKNRWTLVRTFVWYVEQFRDDSCETVILADGKPAVELSFRLQVDDDLVICGHLDRVVKFNGQAYVMDHKTSRSTISSQYFDQYKPHNQMTLYTLASRIVYKQPVSGVIIDAAQIAVGFSRFSRGFTYRTPAELDEWLDNTHRVVADARRMAEEYDATNNLAAWPMNDTACHKYRGCQFRDVCSSAPSVRQNLLDSNFTERKWNPLETR